MTALIMARKRGDASEIRRKVPFSSARHTSKALRAKAFAGAARFGTAAILRSFSGRGEALAFHDETRYIIQIMHSPDPQKLAQDFSDDEAVWRAFDARKSLRDLFGPKDPLDSEAADALDWMWAERHARPVRANGIALP